MSILIRILIVMFLPGLVLGRSLAQGELQKCSENQSEAINKILTNGKGEDSTALKNIIELDQQWKECVIGKTIPDFSAKTISGVEINSSELQGKILVINFWFIACTPCIAELPALNQLAKDYQGKGVVFLGITFEKKEDIINKFLPQYSFDFTLVPDAGFIEDSFGVWNHPAIFIIDQKGKVKKAWLGGSIGENAKTEAYIRTKPFIDELLKVQ